MPKTRRLDGARCWVGPFKRKWYRLEQREEIFATFAFVWRLEELGRLCRVWFDEDLVYDVDATPATTLAIRFAPGEGDPPPSEFFPPVDIEKDWPRLFCEDINLERYGSIPRVRAEFECPEEAWSLWIT